MTAIRATPPAAGNQPMWAEHWAAVAIEWDLAARDVCQLADRTQSTVATYLRWTPGEAGPGESSWWYSEVDWHQLAGDLAEGRTTLSSSEKALARVAVGLAARRGEVEYQALHSAGYLTEILDIVRRCATAIDTNGAAH